MGVPATALKSCATSVSRAGWRNAKWLPPDYEGRKHGVSAKLRFGCKTSTRRPYVAEGKLRIVIAETARRGAQRRTVLSVRN